MTTMIAKRKGAPEVARPFVVFTPLREGTLEPESRTARVVIMTEGLGNL
jgi:hypothetical protein